MSDITKWLILSVDDDPVVCQQIEGLLNDEVVSESGVQVHTLNHFNEALKELEKHGYDLVILDVKWDKKGQVDKDKGVRVLNDIQKRRFVPVVFYTEVPDLVRDLETPLVRVVDKAEGLPRLLEVLTEVFQTGLPTVNRALIRHMEAVQRDYMWNFVADHWAQISNKPDHTDIAYLLARRLALSLSDTGIHQLAEYLGGRGNGLVAEGKVHPMRYYVMPPVEPAPLAGDIYWGKIGEKEGYWVLLTPSCDMVTGREKAEQVLLAGCDLLVEQAEYQKWHAKLPKPSKSAVRELRALLSNNRRRQPDRFYCLPGALSLPDLIVDFQNLITIPRVESENKLSLANLERLSSLDSPFAEALLARFARYFGRLGTPDLDVDAIMTRLET